MYNLNGENVNDNPNGFSGNEPAGTPNPDNNAQMNYGQPAPEQQTYNQPENGPQTYDAPNTNQQQAFNQTIIIQTALIRTLIISRLTISQITDSRHLTMETPIMETATMQHLPTISTVMRRKNPVFLVSLV